MQRIHDNHFQTDPSQPAMWYVHYLPYKNLNRQSNINIYISFTVDANGWNGMPWEYERVGDITVVSKQANYGDIYLFMK